MQSLNKILPLSLVPQNCLQEYKVAEKLMEGIADLPEGQAKENYKKAIMQSMEGILNTITTDTFKKQKMQEIESLCNTIKSNKVSSSYNTSSYNSSSISSSEDSFGSSRSWSPSSE